VNKDEVLLSADTIVDLDGMVIGKPEDSLDGLRLLRLLRGKPHTVHTAISLFIGENNRILRDVCHTKVFMRNFSDEEIEAYVRRNDHLDKAGAYAIQDQQFHPVEKIDGCYSNVMGLPLCQLYRLLGKAGFSFDINIADLCQGYNDITCEIYQQVMDE
jgi:MAF protein